MKIKLLSASHRSALPLSAQPKISTFDVSHTDSTDASIILPCDIPKCSLPFFPKQTMTIYKLEPTSFVRHTKPNIGLKRYQSTTGSTMRNPKPGGLGAGRPGLGIGPTQGLGAAHNPAYRYRMRGRLVLLVIKSMHCLLCVLVSSTARLRRLKPLPCVAMAMQAAEGTYLKADQIGLERKQAEMLQRLQEKDVARQLEITRRRDAAGSDKDPREDVAAYLERFSGHLNFMEASLGGANVDQDLKAAVCDGVARDLLEEERRLAAASYYLSPYDLKACQLAMNKVQDSLDFLRGSRKKFSFSGKKGKAKSVLHSDPSADFFPIKVLTPSSDPESVAALVPEVDNQEMAGCIERNRNVTETDELLTAGDSIRGASIQGQKSSVFVLKHEDVRGKEVTLRDLIDCKIHILGPPTALFLHSLVRCQVFCGPVQGAAHIEKVDNSLLVLASHQIRIHSSHGSDFYIRVRSRPIIEYSTDIKFAPYAMNYRGLNADLEETSIQNETGLWQNVDDFSWLRASQSPNWSIIPLQNRRVTTQLDEE